MRVVLGRELVTAPPADPAFLAHLCVALHQHEPYHDEIEGRFDETPLYRTLCASQPWMRDLLDRCGPITTAFRMPRVQIGGPPLGALTVLTPAEAVAWLTKPIAVVVEDLVNDGRCFREFVRRKWRGDADSLARTLASTDLRHAGGQAMGPTIRAAAEVTRVLVMVDSDRGAPDAPLGWTAIEACRERDAQNKPTIQVVVLHRHEAENYLSWQELNEWGHRNGVPVALLEAWRRGGRWRWYFDMKKGGSIPDSPSTLATMCFGKRVIHALVETVGPRQRELLDHDDATDLDALVDLLMEFT